MTCKILAFVSLIFAFSISAFPQFDCRSSVAGSLHQIKQSGLSIGAEATLAEGLMTDRIITNILGIIAIDYVKTKHNFYFEGGLKGWRYANKNTNELFDFKTGSVLNKNRLGIREGFYKYTVSNFNLTAGFQTLKSADLMLINERLIGLNSNYTKNALSLNIYTGSVLKEFMRMGSYCGVRYIYNQLRDPMERLAGNAIGESNVAGFVLTFTPSKKAKPEEVKKEAVTSEDEFKTPGDEFSSDEFKSTDETDTKKTLFAVDNYGLTAYSEFGSYYNNIVNVAGLFCRLTLPFDFKFSLQPMIQISDSNNAFSYYAEISKLFSLKLNRIKFNIAYLANHEISKNSFFMPAYSNLYIGEVLRMDTWHAPLFISGAQYSFANKMNPYFRLRYSKQLINSQNQSIDFECGIKVASRIRLTGIYSNISSKLLNLPVNLLRIELRVNI